MGKRCYLSLYAIPKDSDLLWIKELLWSAHELPLDGVEVHNMGLLGIVREILGDIPIHLGVFGNLYTHETARVLQAYGVERVFPNAELSLEELIYIRDHSPVQVIVPLHGKIPLAISGTCFVTDYTGHVPAHCEESCSQGHWLTHEDWQLKSIGRTNLSGKDLCMLEYLDRLVQSDLNLFYIYTPGESPTYIETIGRIYQEALHKTRSGVIKVPSIKTNPPPPFFKGGVPVSGADGSAPTYAHSGRTLKISEQISSRIARRAQSPHRQAG